MLGKPSAFVPVAMSVTALVLLLGSLAGDVAKYGAVVREADEGTVAHLFQLLMAGQVPVLGFFAVKWLPRVPGPAFSVLGLQIAAALAALAPVFLLHL